MKINFYGASQTVTGSCFKVDYVGGSLLVDCGMFQGVDVEENNYNEFPFDPKKLDAVILTHAHLDHCGLLPKLVRQGFTGKIFLTKETAELTKVILADSAKLQELQEQDAKVSLPVLYDSFDAEETFKKFVVTDFFKDTSLSDDVFFKLIPAGHILGSASVVLNVEAKVVVFSGDLGRINQAIIKDFDDYSIPEISPDYIIMESLYGGVEHEGRIEDIVLLTDAINEAINRGGKVIIPVFALHRAQEMLEILKVQKMLGRIPDTAPVYLDSPMAMQITDIYKSNLLSFNQATEFPEKEINYSSDASIGGELSNTSRFDMPELVNVRRSKKSGRISGRPGSIILAGSGMADGGRVVKHLVNNLEDPKNVVIFVGYQAEETLGRELVEGAQKVNIGGKVVKVNAKIMYLRGFSAHADNSDLISWLDRFAKGRLKSVFLIHGEPERMEEFSKILKDKGLATVVPALGSAYEID